MKKDCGKLQRVNNGVVSAEGGTKFSATALYTCSRGFELIGNAERKCGTDGLWSGHSPKCQVKKCPIMTAPSDGSVECTGTEYQQFCSFTCNKGHKMTGTAQRTCRDDRTWSGADVTCSVVECGGLNSPENAKKTCEATTYGKTCKFQCLPGYDQSGSAARTCGESGTWSGVETRCAPKQCEVLTAPDNGAMECSKTEYNGVCTSKCSEGYTFCGSEERRCDENGKWTGKAADCKIVTCPEL